MMHEDQQFTLLPNGVGEPFRMAAVSPMTHRTSTRRTLHLGTEARRRSASPLSSCAMTSTTLDAAVSIACLVFAAIATAGWALPALLRLFGLAGGPD